MHEIDPSVVPIVAAVVAVLAIGVIVVLATRFQRRRLAELEPLFEPGSVRLGRLASGIEGRLRGYPCRYAVQHRSQYSPGGASLRIGVVAPHGWTARAEGVLSRALAGLGLSRDLELGDAELDRRLRFAASSTSELLSALGTDSARAAISRLAEGPGFQSLRVRSERIDLRWAPFDRARDLGLESVRRRFADALDLVVAIGYPPRVG